MEMASGVNDDSQTTWTEELRAHSEWDFPVNFTAGLFYEHDSRAFLQNGSIGYLGPDPVTGNTNLFGSYDTYSGKTYSGFAELNWKIAPNLELAGGARYTDEEKSGNMDMTYVHTYLLLVDPTIAAPVGQHIIGSFAEHNTSPQVTLTWHPTDDVMLYAAYKTGFKSGGFSTPAIIPYGATVQNQQFHQETAKGGEFGLKFTQMDGKLTGDVTAYHYLYTGLQVTAFDAATTSYFVQNAAAAPINGAEANVNYQATSQLSFRGSVGYNRARYESFPSAQCWADQTQAQGCGIVDPNTGKIIQVQNLAGQPLERAPVWSIIAGSSYNTPITNEITLGLTADYRYSSGYFLEASDSPYAYQGAFSTINASARLYDGDWELAVIGTNLTNTVYGLLASDKPLGLVGQTIASLGAPRQIYLQITRHF
jgi:outer membrane receptor protein involved in Fe transport